MSVANASGLMTNNMALILAMPYKWRFFRASRCRKLFTLKRIAFGTGFARDVVKDSRKFSEVTECFAHNLNS